MDRREAMLRELNLYPLWVRRERPVQELPPVPLAAERPDRATDHKTNRHGASSASEYERAYAGRFPHPNPEKTTSHSTKPSYDDGKVAGYLPEGEGTNESLRDFHVNDDTQSVSMPRNDEAAPLAQPAEDIFSLPADKADRQAGADTLREFQLKNAGGALGQLDWPELREKVQACAQCGLRAGCTQTVFGVGNEQADWLFVGEAPGAEEDATGEPFTGHAGRLLDNMLLAIKLKRSEVYIANVIKCRPPDDRHPHVGEVAACLPYLKRQIGLVQPKIIVALGKTAASALLGTDATIASLRGSVHDYQGIPLIVTFHPAYLLRSPLEKAKTWQDLRLAVASLKG